MDKWKKVRLGDILAYEQPTKYIVESTDYDDDYKTPVLTAGQSFILGYTSEEKNIFNDFPVVIFDDFTTAIKYVDFPFKVKSSAMKILKPMPNIDLRYVYYYMKTIKIDTQLHKRYWISEYTNIEIPFPPLDVQHQIADILDSTSILIEKRKTQINKMDLLIKSQFIEMFGDPVFNEKGWQTIPLQNACISIVDCPHSTPSYTKEDTGYMCIRTSIVKKNCILWEDIEFIPKEEYLQRIKRRKPRRGDIIYTREGAILGIAAIIDRECDVALGQRSMLLSPDTTKCLPDFLSVAMNFDSFLNKVLEGISGSASPHINVGDIRSYSIMMPPLALQSKFADLVYQVETQRKLLQSSLTKLELEYKSLMQKCFRGEIF